MFCCPRMVTGDNFASALWLLREPGCTSYLGPLILKGQKQPGTEAISFSEHWHWIFAGARTKQFWLSVTPFSPGVGNGNLLQYSFLKNSMESIVKGKIYISGWLFPVPLLFLCGSFGPSTLESLMAVGHSARGLVVWRGGGAPGSWAGLERPWPAGRSNAHLYGLLFESSVSSLHHET